MTDADYQDIWIYAEHEGDQLLPVYSELLTKAKELASHSQGTRVCSIVLGSDVDQLVKQVAATGTDVVYYADDPKLARYNVDYYSLALEKLISDYMPKIFLLGATSVGSELAPTVAAKVHTGLAAHCVNLLTNDQGDLVGMVPAFGGKVISEILIPKAHPQMASVRPGILTAAAFAANPDAVIIKDDVADLAHDQSGIQFVGFKPNPVTTQKLEQADIVVCAGRGISSQEAWQHIQTLADRLGASIGYTRGLMDNGWTDDESRMIGTSGKSIKPKVYLGFGVSGAMHHVGGIQKSKVIISVNRDDDAKVFDVSDYKVVADADKVVQALIRKLG